MSSTASSVKTLVGVREGHAYLAENARGAWDFTRIPGNLGDAATQVNDIGPTANHAGTGGGTFAPTVGIAFIDGATIKNALLQNDNTNKLAYVAANASTALFKTSFEIHVLFGLNDGQVGTIYLFGINNGAGKRAFMYIDATGHINFHLNISGATTHVFTSTATLNNGPVSPTYARVRIDFETDVASLWIDGIADTFSLSSGTALSDTTDPASYADTLGVAIGGTRTGTSTIASGSGKIQIYKAAVTGLLTSAQAAMVGAYISHLK